VAGESPRTQRALRKIGRERTTWLTASAAVEALLMLLVLPAAIVMQALHYAWLPLLIAFLIVHASTVWWFFAACAPSRVEGPHGLPPIIAIVLNPMAAIRSGDSLTQAIFDASARN
jgi:Flp pilus assembly protein TadB